MSAPSRRADAAANYDDGRHVHVVYVQPMPAAGVRMHRAPFVDPFSEKVVRHAFIRKVYLILMAQLAVTAAITCIFMFVDPVKKFVQRYWWLVYIAMAVYFVFVIIIFCIGSVRRHFPINFICLGILTLAISFMCGTITSYSETRAVLIAVGITGFVCLAVSIFAMQVRIDFTMCTGLIYAASMCFLMVAFVTIMMYMIIGPNLILHCVYGGVAALVFSLYLVYDTQLIIGGRTQQLSAEEHIYGAVALYIDICFLFLIILGFSNMIR